MVQIICKIAEKFRVVGGWETVHDHMLRRTAISSFTVDDGCEFELSYDGRVLESFKINSPLDISSIDELEIELP